MKRFPLFVCLFLLLLLVAAGIPIAAASPAISGVSPGTGPNNGVVSVTITGSGFTSTGTVYLYKCALVSGSPGSERRFQGSVRSWSPTQITATFSLDGKKAGNYGVIVDTTDPVYGLDEGYRENIFTVYAGTGSTITTTTTETTETVTTTTTSAEGENSVFFETSPTGASIYLDGNNIGTSTFTYYTNREGTYDVVVRKTGYEDYSAKVTILEGKRIHFYAPLTQLSSNTTGVTTTSSATPGKNTTTTRKSTLKIPTPLGTDPPVTEESPVDPAIALWAAGIGTALVVIRRR
jgi:hypothetical protein